MIAVDPRNDENPTIDPPKQLSSIDVEPLKKICQDYINALANDGYADEDFDHYIFETAMECIFGKDVWRFVNFVKS